MRELTRQDWLVLTRIAVSVIVLLAALSVILFQGFPDSHLKWAFGVVGVILGYWLK
jgi:hypothetical protein